jgi:hypothetical protein
VEFLGISWELSLLSLPPLRYPECMGKNIQQTLTITITETWIIAWVTDDDPLRQAVTIVQNAANTKEGLGENLQATVNKTESGKPSASGRKKRPPKARKTMT